MSREKTLHLEDSMYEDATQKQDSNGRFPIVSGKRTEHQNSIKERRNIPHILTLTAAADQQNAQKSVVSTESFQEQEEEEHEDEELTCEASRDINSSLTDDRPSDLDSGDPITSKRTFDLVEDLLTPLPTVPMDVSYETIAKACNCRVGARPADGVVLTFSPEEQAMFDEWLVPMSPGGTIK